MRLFLATYVLLSLGVLAYIGVVVRPSPNMFLLVGVLVPFITLIPLVLVGHVLDRIFAKSGIGKAKVMKKFLIPANEKWTWVYDPLNKVKMLEPLARPDLYVLEVRVGKKRAGVVVPKDVHQHVEIGAEVTLRYLIGGIFGNLYPKALL